MADGTGLQVTGGDQARAASAAGRRLRALGRRLLAAARTGVGLKAVQGCVEGVVGAEVRGWALDPGRPGRRVHVIARCAGKVVAEGLADLPRRDLLKHGRGDGRCGFLLQLPPELAAGPARRVRIEALSPFARTRLVGGDVMVGTVAAPAAEPAPASAPALRPPPASLALLVWGSGEPRSLAEAWAAEPWPHLALARLGEDLRDAEALKAFARAAHTVVIARPGDRIEPGLARVLAEARPLADVLTFDDPSTPWGLRPEARALGVRLGERLGSFAVRGQVLAAHADDALLARDDDALAGLERRLAADRSLRWTHLPTPLLLRSGPAPAWRAAAPPDPPAVERLTLAVWPADAPGWRSTVHALIEAAPADLAIEVLAPPGVALQADRPVEVRAVDPPGPPGEGRWLRALGEAAGGEVVLFCRAGLRPPAALEPLVRWAASPGCGAATVQIDGADGPLAGLAVARSADGWSLRSGFDPARAGQARPVLAAPAAFMTVWRARLVAAGGVDDRRFPEAGADLDLGLRLRAMGCPSLLLDGAAGAELRLAPLAGPAVFAAFEADALAAAAQAYPPA